MATTAEYQHLENRPDKSTRELCVRGTGIRASTIWHDRYVWRHTPAQIAQDRDIPLEAVHEALVYCQENWEIICEEKESERERLDKAGLFNSA